METLLVTLVLLVALAASGVLRGPWRAAPSVREASRKAPVSSEPPPRRPPRARAPVDSGRDLPDRGQLRQLALRLSRIETALDSGEAVLAPRLRQENVDVRRRVHALARAGMEPPRIARELGVSLGEVELALRMGARPAASRRVASRGPSAGRS